MGMRRFGASKPCSMTSTAVLCTSNVVVKGGTDVDADEEAADDEEVRR